MTVKYRDMSSVKVYSLQTRVYTIIRKTLLGGQLLLADFRTVSWGTFSTVSVYHGF